MRIDNVIEGRKRMEARERKIPTYERVVSLADKVFGREHVSAAKMEFKNSMNSLYIDDVKKSGPLICKVKIELILNRDTEVTVFDEAYFDNAKRFAKEYEKIFDKFQGQYGNEIILRHNLIKN